MPQIAMVLGALATATLVAACGGHAGHEHLRFDAGVGQFNVMTRGYALPEGHPPVGGHHRALPQGHPPLPGFGDGLPPGHPVCPAGRQQLERNGEKVPGDNGAGPRVISI